MSEKYKKFGELPRAEQLELIEHVLDSGEVEIFSNTSWHNTEMDKSGVVCFHNDYCYRKFKSELDLLKEQRNELDKKIEKLEGGISVGDTVIHKLDASRKEYEVLEDHLCKDTVMIGGYPFYKNWANVWFIKVQQQ